MSYTQFYMEKSCNTWITLFLYINVGLLRRWLNDGETNEGILYAIGLIYTYRRETDDNVTHATLKIKKIPEKVRIRVFTK